MLENVQPIEDIFLITNTRILYDIIHSNFSLLKSLIDIHIKDWKRTGWFHNIDIETFRKFSKDTKNNMVASIITELAKNNLIIKNPNNSYLGTEHPNFTDIHKTVDYKIFTKNKKAFKQHNIIFLEQITTHDNRNILPWNKIYIRKFGTNKAQKEPKWFQNITTKSNNRRKNNWAIIANDDNSIMLIKLISIQKNNYEFKKLNIINIINNEIITEVTELTNKIENCKIYKTGKIKINKKDNQIIWKIPYLELVHSIPNQTKWFDIFKPIPSELNNTIQIEPYDMVQIKTTIKNNDTLSTTLNIQKMIQRNFTHKPIECFYISKHHNHNKNSSNISFAWLIPTITPMPFHGKAYNYCSSNRAEAECIKHILL
ncbi:15598_t:CDS:2 [Entrophospora sp. SA101]|nr:15598_t:CDS:2 [Entrophospora sp. SA101]